MKAKHFFLILPALLLTTCEKEQPDPPDFSSKITVATGEVSDITYPSAIVTAALSDTHGQQVSNYGHCWDTLDSPTIEDNKTAFGAIKSGKSYNSILRDLKLDKRYFVRAYFVVNNYAVYGNELSFIARDGTPSLTTEETAEITANSASSGGNITEDGAAIVATRGVCWNTSGSPDISNSKTNDGSGIGSFSSNLTGLTENTTYYVRAYATNEVGTSYGDEVTFTTKDGIAVLTTTEISEITTSTALSGGTITDNGGATITARGVCWNTSGSPTIIDSKTNDGSGTGNFISELTGLTENTTYYVRAYATNSYGIEYGQEISFIAKDYLTDYDGTIYETVKMGNLVWMAENLKVTHYPDGSAIPLVTDNNAWANLADNNADDAYCYYGNNSSSEYGALYTYAAALNACPAGWRLPSDAEWTELENYLADNGYNYDNSTGGSRSKIAKSMATDSGWNPSSTIGAVGNSDYPAKRNASKLSALPGGNRGNSNGAFYLAGGSGYWWSSTEIGSNNAYGRYLYYNHVDVRRVDSNKSAGFSVRCVRDD